MPDPHHAYEQVQGIYFPVATSVFVLIVGTLVVLLVRGARRQVPGARSRATAFELTYALLLSCVAALLVWTTFRAETPIDRTVSNPALHIKVIAAQWSWRFEYPNGRTVTAVSTWHPPAAVVPTGVEVEFAATSRDVIHGFWVPQLHFQRQVLPGYVTRFDLIFHASGLYGGVCSVFCGQQHSQMHFELRAVSRGEFQRWLASSGGSS
jgi:cytochrome c oxidase subunit 2